MRVLYHNRQRWRKGAFKSREFSHTRLTVADMV
jgi:hypothetical protein